MLVLSGGFGTRLRSTISDVPKSLAPVLQRPYLFYLIENWRKQGITSFIFLLHHQAEMIIDFLHEVKQLDILEGSEVRTIVEPHPLGTGGAIAYCVKELSLNGDFLVTNADTWLGTGIVDMEKSQSPSIAVIKVSNSERYGSVLVEENNIVSFKEKYKSTGSSLINAGLYRLNAEMFRDWDGRAYSLEKELFPKFLNIKNFKAVLLRTEFIDIGIPDDYFRFCRWIENGKIGAL